MKGQKGRLILTVVCIIAICCLGVAIELATGTEVVGVVSLGENEALPTPTPPPKYAMYINTSTKKIHAENCHYVDGSENIVPITEEGFFEYVAGGAEICAHCEEELEYLVDNEEKQYR